MRRLFFSIAIISLFLAAGCGGETTAPVATAPPAPTPSGVAQPVLAVSELVVGPNRFVFGLVDSGTGQPIVDVAQVGLQFFKVNADGTATKVGDADVVYQSKNLPAGLYVARTEFKEPGKWGAILNITRQGKEPYGTRMEFDVLADSTVPMVGEPAPPSKNLTKKDVADISEIDSASPPSDMHDLTIAEAVTSGKPTLVLFAAPGFCPSFTCGPSLEVAQALQAKYGDKVNFIHIEAPNDIQNHTHTGPVDPNHHQQPGHQGVAKPQVETAKEWGLKSEPWIFLVDKEGKIADRFEGGLTLEEVEPAFVKLLQ
ncbi:MAG TPA: hypothetical protein VEW94_05330 [Chloroflexia bacterium]|nr:hypothetical protein [Chloroflexia bacterium]